MTIHAQPFGTPEIAGKTVLVRIDIEALTGTNSKALADALAATVGDLTRRRARVIILSERGQPSSGSFDPALSLRPLAIALSMALDKVVTFIPGRVDATSLQAIATVAEGSVGLLESLRFAADEDSDDGELAKALAGLGHYHIDVTAGSVGQRASTHAMARLMPSCTIRIAA